jgi:pimeloyl-ACP methyl ester carboxylesterase
MFLRSRKPFVTRTVPPCMKKFLLLLRRLALGLLALVIAWLLLATGYGRYAAARDRTRYPPAGVLVQLDGRQLHVVCTGQGAPTVVLESALGGPTVLWEQIQPAVARTTRVCSYDRDGIGWSSESGKPRTAARYAEELHRALAAAGERGPYVVVGHSIGGMLALNFARAFPADVAGLVLLDPTHPRQFTRGSEQWDEHRQMLKYFAIAPAIAELGLAREALWATDKLKPLPLSPATRAAYIALASTPKAMGAMRAEAEALFQLCAASWPFPSLGNKPLLVLSAGRTLAEGFPPAYHEEMAHLSTVGKREVVDGASHSGLVLRPEPAQRVVEAIIRVVRAARQ